ncbi:MAG: cobalamin-dependent protein [Desulfobulbaceae bacterium]|nr:cobalamin-dependent protein [Desulfobulbaceae bacterium]
MAGVIIAMALDCLLISANKVVTPYPVYPLGLAHISAALLQAGHRVSQFDMLAEGGAKPLRRLLQNHNYQMIGVSIRNLDTVDSTAPEGFLPEIAATVDLVRQHSQAVIVLGGAGFSIMPEELLALLKADYGVVGAGEILMPWLADQIAAGNLPRENIFKNPSPDYSWHKPVYSSQSLPYYDGHGGMLNIQTKRGCPFRCSYCTYPAIEGRTMHYRDPEETADEVFRLKKEHGVKFIFFTDGVFNDQKGHFRMVAEALAKRGNKTPWSAFFRPVGLREEDLILMKKAGLAAMEVGTDAGCDQTLAALDKGFFFSDVLKTNNLARKAAVPCAHFVMFGGPDEDQATLDEGLANMAKLEECVIFAFAGIRILPKTTLHQRAIADGVISADQALLAPTFYFSPKLAELDLGQRIQAAFAGRLDRIYPCSRVAEQIAMLHNVGHVGPLWDALLPRRQ